MKKVFIIVDGSNFYHRLKELQVAHPLQLDYGKFATFLLHGRSLAAKKYYIGAIREERGNPKSRVLMADQQKLTGRLKRDGWQVGFGHMLKTDGYHEKGVDVQIAVDLLVGAYENLYDTAVLVSSDTDLLPALEKVRLMGKMVEYISFSHKPSYGLITHSDIRRLLTIEDMKRFFGSRKGSTSSP